mmetsp:Transcript_25324/g.75226  ORF Transcript_25324/g.75226 Transcript_25324/m.75226 type:complete len:188 (+) Transcript_25324:175-738(+)
MMVQGNTVAVMGPHRGLKQVRKLVEDCFRNYHPVYHIKAMMIKRELERDPTLQQESWDRFLPKFKKQNVQRKKAKGKARKEREYTPFPPAPTPRKVDLQLESGEYFLSDEQKRARKQEARDQKQAEASAASAAKRQARFVAPKEAAARPAAAKRKPAEERSAADLAATLRGKDAAGKKRRVRGGQGV